MKRESKNILSKLALISLTAGMLSSTAIAAESAQLQSQLTITNLSNKSVDVIVEPADGVTPRAGAIAKKQVTLTADSGDASNPKPSHTVIITEQELGTDKFQVKGTSIVPSTGANTCTSLGLGKNYDITIEGPSSPLGTGFTCKATETLAK